jgi:hypothetical protein
MNKYWKFQGKIITLSSFFVGPLKRVQFAYLGPTADIREKMVGAESVNVYQLFFEKLGWIVVLRIPYGQSINALHSSAWLK